MVIRVLILFSFAFSLSCKNNFNIELQKGESYVYNSLISEPTTYDITGTESLNVNFKYGQYIERCTNVTFCTKEYGECKSETFDVVITITSNKNNNHIKSSTHIVDCDVVSYVLLILVISVISLAFLCFLYVTCYYVKYKKETVKQYEDIPLLQV